MSQQQEQLFYDSELEALRDDVNALGGPKDVGRWFWPEKSIEASRNMVNDRLNAERRDRFTDEQKRLVMRRVREKRGFSATLIFICDDTGFERPKVRDPADEQALLVRTIQEASVILKGATERLDRLARAPVVNIGGGKQSA